MIPQKPPIISTLAIAGEWNAISIALAATRPFCELISFKIVSFGII